MPIAEVGFNVEVGGLAKVKQIWLLQDYGVQVLAPIEYWKVLRLPFTLTWDPNQTRVVKAGLYIKWEEQWAKAGEVEVVLNDVKVYRGSGEAFLGIFGVAGDEATADVTGVLNNGENRLDVGLSGVGFLNRYYMLNVRLDVEYEGEDTFTFQPKQGVEEAETPEGPKAKPLDWWAPIQTILQFLLMIFIVTLLGYLIAYLPPPPRRRE